MSQPPTFDLQSHSKRSDGSLDPRAVVQAAAGAGVELFALSDHDTVAGVDEALGAARQLRVRVVPAVEISALGASDGDLHMLGYCVDHREPELLGALERFRADRERRARAMAGALRAEGFRLDEQLLAKRAAAGETIGRPHLALAVVSCAENTARLQAEGRRDASAFLEGYLVPGRPAFRPRLMPSIGEAIAAIHAAGGVAVWAHPFWAPLSGGTVPDAIDRFCGQGLDGVECFYPSHTREQTESLVECCEALDLLRTGSSDFHGPEHRLFSRFRAFSTYGREPKLGPIAG